jgi:hypothetical protein
LGGGVLSAKKNGGEEGRKRKENLCEGQTADERKEGIML